MFTIVDSKNLSVLLLLQKRACNTTKQALYWQPFMGNDNVIGCQIYFSLFICAGSIRESDFFTSL